MKYAFYVRMTPIVFCNEIIFCLVCLLSGGGYLHTLHRENIMSRFRSLVLAGATLALAAAATSAALAQQNRYEAKVLVSDGFVPNVQPDPHLVNGWGIALSGTSPMWVADNGTGLSTIYTGLGGVVPLVVTIPPAPGNTQGKPTGI